MWLNKDQNCPKKGWFVCISGIEEYHKWKQLIMKYIYLLQLEDK